MRAKRFIDMAHSVAMLSRYGSYRFGSLILFGGRVISAGTNHRRTHPRGIGHNSSVHAELQAIRIAESRVGDVSGSTIVVARVGREGEFLPSFPCSGCIELIISKGIANIVYIGHDLRPRKIGTNKL